MYCFKKLLVTLAASLPLLASAGVFGFEDLSVPNNMMTPVPAGYAGADFNGFFMRRSTELQYTGLNSNDVSGALAVGVGSAPSIHFLQPTTFGGLFLIHPSGALSFDLLLAGQLMASSGGVGVLAQFYASPYAGAIDTIVFHQGENDAFSIDDLNAVLATADSGGAPALAVAEPAGTGLLLFGLALLAARVHRRTGVHAPRGRAAVRIGAGLALLTAAQLASAQVSLSDEAGSSFKGTSRVAIAQFGVEYYTQLTSIGRSGGNTAKQVSNLVGVSDAAMQALVDKLYADTVAKLKAAGFDVVEQAVVAADPGYQALVAEYAKPSPMVMHDSQGLGDGEHISKVFAPAGMQAFYASAGSSGGFLRGNMADRFRSQNHGTGRKEAEVAKSLKATLLKFSFLANYGITKASKNGLLANFANIASRVTLETAAVLQPYDTQVQWVDATGARMFGNVRRAGQTGAFYLDKPLQGENIFSPVETTSAEVKQDESISNAVFSLFNTKASTKSQALAIGADDPSYTAAYGALLATADDALIGALKNGR